MTNRIPHWVGGARSDLGSTRTGPVHNPATGEVTGEVLLASSDDVKAAVASAREAAGDWRESSLSRRAAVLFACRELLHRPRGRRRP